jgi:hypothetical protein
MWRIVIIVIIAALFLPQFRKVLLIFAAIASVGFFLLIANETPVRRKKRSLNEI